ncbi:carboxy terminal-processing peptidase [Flavobacterium sp.]|uniref:carboxy terminal-processing peptidase n=1 Tax=Flavobacterium sp. TaxID=239 RepID=UPI00286E0374|nr:carboxy terminal-processing peptidase [Flavobacterium sp.]
MNTIWEFMKRNYKILIVLVAISATLWGFMPKTVTTDPEKDKALLDLIDYVIKKGHYSPVAMDDEFSKSLFKTYIDALDPSKRFFLESDITEFKKYETEIDDLFLDRDLSFFNLTFERIQKRIRESKVVYKSISDKAFEFSSDETVDIGVEKLPFAKNYTELKNRWRLQIKLTVLSYIVDKQKMEADKKAKNPKYVEKTLKEIEKESRESSLKSLDDYFDFVEDLEKKDWFVAFVNSIVVQYDPHTYYFAPEEKERFDISMSGKLEGIGARLQKKNDYTEISELISGGPAWRGKELEPGDLIMKVGQGSAQPLDVVGMRLDDVVKKIKGKRGSEVKLTVKKVDGSIKVISIIRDIVEIEETYAKSTITIKDGKKYGVIYLPKFYIDFENDDNRDSAKDIAIEIERLKSAGVEGIVMDLRDNGGGSLKTVVDIAGLFIKEGPIVQIRSAKAAKEVLYDKDARVQWDGPLVVMINNFSASASEIFAAAIQDYNRGIIVGSKQSYGKGTVQNVIDLNQIIRNSSMGDFGALKTTTQKFYRINGGSTQLEGVSSDVAMPDRYSYIKIGERDELHAMPWDKIDAAPYKALNNMNNFADIILKSKKRVSENTQFKLIDESARWVNDRKENNIINLNIDKFKKEQTSIEEATKKYKSIYNYTNKLDFTSKAEDLIAEKKDTVLAQKKKDWYDLLKKDVYVEEAVSILSDLQKIHVSSKNTFAKNNKTKTVNHKITTKL